MSNETPLALPELEHKLARAFDLAWEKFTELEAAEENTAENRGALAARIVVLAKLGEEDVVAIAEAALLYLRALAASKRLSASPQGGPVSIASAGAVLDQEAITAATTALDACLEELPEGIPSRLRSALLQTILEHAGRGERSSERLQRFALDALKSR
jgi:hypothetical protein